MYCVKRYKQYQTLLTTKKNVFTTTNKKKKINQKNIKKLLLIQSFINKLPSVNKLLYI